MNNKVDIQVQTVRPMAAPLRVQAPNAPGTVLASSPRPTKVTATNKATPKPKGQQGSAGKFGGGAPINRPVEVMTATTSLPPVSEAPISFTITLPQGGYLVFPLYLITNK